jgi:hypothetical protein
MSGCGGRFQVLDGWRKKLNTYQTYTLPIGIIFAIIFGYTRLGNRSITSHEAVTRDTFGGVIFKIQKLHGEPISI